MRIKEKKKKNNRNEGGKTKERERREKPGLRWERTAHERDEEKGKKGGKEREKTEE